mgnify:CR=1 FL=1
MIISNVLLFTVEFLKTYIASAGIFKIKQKRKVFFFYLVAVLLLTTLTVLCHFDSLHVMPECGRI